jgi:hypothetical protein
MSRGSFMKKYDTISNISFDISPLVHPGFKPGFFPL